MDSTTVTLDRVLDEARALSVPEQRQLLGAIEEWLAEADRERAFLQRLVEMGLMTEVKRPLQPGEREEFEPVPIQGPPVSEAIIEDRR